MVEALGLFALGLLALALGGDSIVKGASGLAQHFGIRPFTAGLLLVAFGTSVPELAVNLRAIAQVVRLDNETARIHLRGRDDTLPVSRAYLHHFRQM